MCSRTVSDTANRLLKRTDNEGSPSVVEEKSSAVPYFRSGRRSLVCAELSNKGKVGVQRGRETAGVPSFLPPRRAPQSPALRRAQLPAEVQQKTPRPLGANTLTQFVSPAQPMLKRLPPGQGEPPARFRSPRSAGVEKRKEQTFNHLLSGNSILAELLLLCACSLRLLAALYARAFIMLTLAELGKRTRLGTRTLEATQCAVNRLIFLDADLRHSFPSLRTFPSWGSLSTVCIHPYTKP